jgi:hypothetical protein
MGLVVEKSWCSDVGVDRGNSGITKVDIIDDENVIGTRIHLAKPLDGGLFGRSIL